MLGCTTVLFPGGERALLEATSRELPGIDVEFHMSLLELHESSVEVEPVSIVPAGARIAPVCCSGQLISSMHRRTTPPL